MSSQVRVGLFWRFALGIGAIAAPVIAYGVVGTLVDGDAKKEYYEAVAQILATPRAPTSRTPPAPSPPASPP
jgi:hypothetical protein